MFFALTNMGQQTLARLEDKTFLISNLKMSRLIGYSPSHVHICL